MIWRFLLVWAALLGFYLLFAGEVSTNELLAGVPASAASAAFALALHRVEERPLRLRAPWPRLVLRPLASIPTGAFKVGTVLIQAILRPPAGPLGAIARQPFREGGDDPADAGRRALVTLASSLAPNGYVLAIGRDALLLHRLSALPPDPDREWPA